MLTTIMLIIDLIIAGLLVALIIVLYLVAIARFGEQEKKLKDLEAAIRSGIITSPERIADEINDIRIRKLNEKEDKK